MVSTTSPLSPNSMDCSTRGVWSQLTNAVFLRVQKLRVKRLVGLVRFAIAIRHVGNVKCDTVRRYSRWAVVYGRYRLGVSLLGGSSIDRGPTQLLLQRVDRFACTICRILLL